MAILGVYPDGGYELWCNECGIKITCFALEELFTFALDYKNFLYMERYICEECRKIIPIDTSEINKEELEKYNELKNKII